MHIILLDVANFANVDEGKSILKITHTLVKCAYCVTPYTSYSLVFACSQGSVKITCSNAR